MSGNKIVKGAAILGIAGLIVKLLGVFLKIPLTAMIGEEGMAYYGYAGSYGVQFPTYYPRYYVRDNEVLTPKDIVEKIQNLTKEQVSLVANKVKLDTVFFLKSNE